MKHLPILQTETYVSVYALIETNSFGDQITTYEHETLDGRKVELGVDFEHEGSHLTNDSIKAKGRELYSTYLKGGSNEG